MTTTLSAIGLQNFQAFSDYTHIPLTPLTLLYGPNSSGKSAVLDAIQVAKAVLDSGSSVYSDLNMQRRNIARLLGPHLRRQADDEPVRDPVIITMEAVADIKGRGKVTYSARLTFFFNDLLWLAGYEFSENGNMVCMLDRLASVSHFALNVKYLALHDLNHLPEKLHNATPPAELDEGILKVPFKYLDENQFKVSVSTFKDSKLADDSVEQGFSFLRQFGLHFEQACLQIRDNVLQAIAFDHVPASRGIPSPEDLSYLLPFGLGPGFASWNDPYGVVEGENLGIYRPVDVSPMPLFKQGIPHYAPLAAECLMYRLEQAFPKHVEWNGESPPHHLNRINDLLSKHLFTERAYRVTADVFLLVEPEFVEERFSVETAYDINDFHALVRLRIADAENRLLNFPQVGSGLGYVFPVIFQGAQEKSCFIEQPELHLHPALQGGIGDLLLDIINGAKFDKVVIVETHSEHLLLRILRRMLETHRDMPQDPSLRCNPDQVSVLYFNPLPDGTTEVRQLRLSRNGEFMDRWPNGFFDERDQEFIDE